MFIYTFYSILHRHGDLVEILTKEGVLKTQPDEHIETQSGEDLHFD